MIALILGLNVLAAHALEVSEPWARATVPGASVGAAYMTLTSPVKARLIAVRSPASGRVEIHSAGMQDGTMRMRQLKSLELPAGQPVTLAPMGLHLMLMELKAPLKSGERVALELVVQEGRKRRIVEVSAEIRSLTQ